MNISFHRTREISFLTLCITIVALSSANYLVDELRYLKYFLIPLSVVLLIQNKIIIQEKIELAKPYLFLVFFCSFTLLFSEASRIKELFFILSYTLPILVIRRNVAFEDIAYAFKLYVLVFLFSLLFKEQNQFNLESSQSLLEGTDSFIFGLFYIFFLHIKKWTYAAIAVVLVILTLKRIVFGACLIATLVMLGENYINYFARKAIVFITSCIFIYLSYLFADGQLNSIVSEFTLNSINYLTMGRYEIQSASLKYWESGGVLEYLLGNGIGSSSVFVNNYTFGRIPLLHNDWAKVVFEMGILGALAFIYFFSNSSHRHLSLSIFISICYLTDNVLIYTNVMFFYLVISCYFNENANKS